jgi:hypothetical protein
MVIAHGRAPSEEQVAEVAPDPAAPGALSFALRAGTRAHGQVVERGSRKPLAGVRVMVEGRAGLSEMVPLTSEVVTGQDGRFELRGVPVGRFSLLASASGYHGRVLGGLDMKGDEDLGPLVVDLAAVKEGEKARIELIGIGARMAAKDGAIVIGEVSSGGGAARAGLEPGDHVLAIDGQPVSELGFGAAVQRIRGAEGTVVVLRVRRAVNGEELDLHVTRALVRGP